MLGIVLTLYSLISVIRALATFGIFDDTERCGYVCLMNLVAITYCNKDNLTKFGIALAVLADLILLPGALFGSILNLVTEGVIYLFNKFCVKQK